MPKFTPFLEQAVQFSNLPEDASREAKREAAQAYAVHLVEVHGTEFRAALAAGVYPNTIRYWRTGGYRNIYGQLSQGLSGGR